ncbi:MAG: hypothetical protein R2794_02075 [Chitinophagales bacterium]
MGFISCNYAFFVPKENVILDKVGYLIFNSDYSLFCATNDSACDGSCVLKYAEKDAILFNSLEASLLGAFEQCSDYVIIPKAQIDNTTISDTMYYCYVRIRALNSDYKSNYKARKLAVDYEGKQYIISPIGIRLDMFYIYPILEKDRLEFQYEDF